MVYVALLRGINVGGKNKVDMAKLKSIFTRNGLINVISYINSGNIIFEEQKRSAANLAKTLGKAIEVEFGFRIKVLIRDYKNIKTINETLPADWVNDSSMKCDVLFLWDEFNNQDTINQLVIKPGIDDVKYVDGAIIWRVDKDKITRSGLLKIIGTDIYKQMTIRNCNTVRKLKLLMEQN